VTNEHETRTDAEDIMKGTTNNSHTHAAPGTRHPHAARGTGNPAPVRDTENGAMLVHVAFGLIVFLGFSTFAIDEGVRWVSRRQAQNAADAGALAGAVARAYDDTAATPDPASGGVWDPAVGGVAWHAAHTVARANGVWLQTPTTVVSWPCPPGVEGRCCRMDVYRNGEFGSTPLPTFFGRVLGVNSQGVRATATAVAAAGSNLQCLKPWIVADRYPASGFEDYVAPYYPGHTGFKIPDDIGLQLTLKEGSPTEGMSSGWTSTIQLPDAPCGGGGGAAYECNITQCNRTIVGIATESQTCPSRNESVGCVRVEPGVMQGPTVHGVKELIAQDSNASWNTSTNSISGGCTAAGDCPGGISPRVVPLALYDPKLYVASGCGGSTCITKVVNMIGFFLEGMCPDVSLDPGNDCGKFPQKTVVGRILMYPSIGGVSPVEDTASFLQVIHLVR
jgi:hypothetical protein